VEIATDAADELRIYLKRFNRAWVERQARKPSRYTSVAEHMRDIKSGVINTSVTITEEELEAHRKKLLLEDEKMLQFIDVELARLHAEKSACTNVTEAHEDNVDGGTVGTKATTSKVESFSTVGTKATKSKVDTQANNSNVYKANNSASTEANNVMSNEEIMLHTGGATVLTGTREDLVSKELQFIDAELTKLGYTGGDGGDEAVAAGNPLEIMSLLAEKNSRYRINRDPSKDYMYEGEASYFRCMRVLERRKRRRAILCSLAKTFNALKKRNKFKKFKSLTHFLQFVKYHGYGKYGLLDKDSKKGDRYAEEQFAHYAKMFST
jgi:hypothetical protein